MTAEERIALFLDYENLAIGAREDLGGMKFDLGPVADALSDRGRVLVRRAYADWSFFDEDRRMLTEHHVELIEIPQRMGVVRKNAADIKMAVDATELCFERDYITTYVIGTGDSDFTPLVDKLRQLDKRVIGLGLQASTSKLLPKACDEFLFYERLEGVAVPSKPSRGDGGEQEPPSSRGDLAALTRLVTQTLSGMQRSTTDPVLASSLKRAILRKEPTFDEASYGFRAFGELMRHLEQHGVVELGEGPAVGDPTVTFPESGGGEAQAFELLRTVVGEAEQHDGPPPLSGMKDRMRRVEPGFSEKDHGFGGFLQFCKSARTRGIVEMDWDEKADDYVLSLPGAS